MTAQFVTTDTVLDRILARKVEELADRRATNVIGADEAAGGNG